MTINVNPPTKLEKPQLSEAAIVRRSAGEVPPPTLQLEPVAKLIDVSKCIGCKACQSACMEWNDTHQPIGEFNGTYENPHDLTPTQFTLMRFTEWVNPQTDSLEWLIRKDGCMHCAEPGCLEACPAPGAIVKYSNGIVDFVHENCIGCGYCVKGCPFNIPRISRVDHTAYKCTLCSDRVAVGQGPACAKACPTQAIVFGTKKEMQAHAEGRITDLKSRGFTEAGVYNPQGVGGTHVMYVLPHADQPELYGGLPSNPRVSSLVKIWKGAAKQYAGLAAIAAFIVGAVVHHALTGTIRVSEDDERRGRKMIEGEK
jgi:formate dehydrogenase iron-sulfur subunit